MSSSPTPATDQPTVIGWREYVDLPDWGVKGIMAKADTGARSSAVDVAELMELPGGRVRFTVIGNRKQPNARTVVETEVVRRTRVKSSFGDAHERIFVVTTIRVAGREIEAELGLVSRRAMQCRMLLGRKTLEHAFLVDPSRCYVHGRKKRKKKKRIPPEGARTT